MDEALHPLTTARTPGLAQVGGKGTSLIEMTRAGLPVPPGFVLTTGFVQPWLDQLRATAEWSAFVEAVNADESYRRRSTRQLNKGESLHSLRRDLFFAHEGTVRRHHHQQQTEQACACRW